MNKIFQRNHCIADALFSLLPAVAAMVLIGAPSHAATNPAAGSKTNLMVRVLVVEEKRTLNVTIKGAYRIWALPAGRLLKKGKGLPVEQLLPTANGLRLGKEEWQTRGLRFEPLEDRDLFLNQSQFRGTVDILKDKNALLYAINRLNVEDYLYGVFITI